MVDAHEGSIRCYRCDMEWIGYATAPSYEALQDVLNRMLWEHDEVVHNDGSSPTSSQNEGTL